MSNNQFLLGNHFLVNWGGSNMGFQACNWKLRLPATSLDQSLSTQHQLIYQQELNTAIR